MAVRFLAFTFLVFFIAGLPSQGSCQSTPKNKEDVPLEDPFYNSRRVAGWTSRKIITVMSLSYTGIERNLTVAKQVFTDNGYQKFYGDLEESGLLMLVEDARMKMSLAPVNSPELLGEGVVDGRYRWAFRIPVVMTMQTVKKTIRDNKTLLLVIVISNEPRHDMLAIEHWALSDRYVPETK